MPLKANCTSGGFPRRQQQWMSGPTVRKGKSAQLMFSRCQDTPPFFRPQPPAPRCASLRLLAN